MKTFYKYTSNFGVGFFKRPTIKISNPNYLNDPFESEAGDNLIHVIDEALKKKGANIDRTETREMVNQLLKSNGIFSVSETSRNPLMWAHYANEHRGLCIGYSNDIFSPIVKPEGRTDIVAEYEPRKVNYDNYRFDRETTIESSTDFIEAIKSALYTKSDEWIYEKEHRCIIPFSCATSFLINREKGSVRSHFDSTMTIDTYITNAIEHGFFEQIGENEYKYTDKTGVEHIIAISTFECISFLYEVEHKYIHSIHAGFRVSNEDIISLYSMIHEKNSNLSHVKLYKYKLSHKRFELLPEQIDDEYISKITK